MISRSYSSEKNATAPVTGGQTGFFNFSTVVLTTSPSAGHSHASRSMKYRDLNDTDGIPNKHGIAALLTVKSTRLKKHHLFWFLIVLVLMQLSHLMAKNDDNRNNWMPPIEPPGSVIVTSLSEGSQSQRPANKAPEAQTRQTPMAAAGTANRQSPSPVQVTDNEAALLQAIQQWSQAWSGRAIPQYLDMYASDFIPAGGLSRPAWVQQRTQRITRNQNIKHNEQDLNIQINASQATVRFTQIYQDEHIRASDRKTMHWVLRNGQWQITRESTD